MKNTLFLLLKAIEEIDISDKAVAAATIECNTNVSFPFFFSFLKRCLVGL